jgi:endonuclease YncB( thermonuclease family)
MLLSRLSLLLVAACSIGCPSPVGARSVPPATAAETSASASEPAAATAAEEPEDVVSTAAIVLNGERVEVRWSDGDSFKIKAGVHAGRGVRLQRYNSLESYGPVHRWGTWTGAELYAIAKAAKDVGKAGVWSCTTAGEADHYGRILVDCPDLAREMVSAGVGHVYSVDEKPADAELIAVQADAQMRGAGIWAKGVPSGIVTSLHSKDEGSEGEGGNYNRLIDAHTGASTQVRHDDVYAVCEEVCAGDPSAPSCMLYVPFARRYRDRPDCLRVADTPPSEKPGGGAAEGGTPASAEPAR